MIRPLRPLTCAWAILTLAALMLPAAHPARSAAADEAAQAAATAVVEELLTELGAVANDADLTTGQRRRLLADLLVERLDYAVLARRALGPLAEGFSADERSDFAVAYARHVTVGLIRQVELGGDEPVRVLGSRAVGEQGAVEVAFEGRERAIGAPLAPSRTRKPVRSVLTLRPRAGEWRIVGVRVGGVDSAELFQSQARSVLAEGTPAELIADLEERTRKFVKRSDATE